MSAAADFSWTGQEAKSEQVTLFHRAPFACAQCQRDGTVTVLNAALEAMIAPKTPTIPTVARVLHFADLIPSENRLEAEGLLADLFLGKCDSFQFDTHKLDGGEPLRWTAWRIAAEDGSMESAIIMAQDVPASAESEQRLHQAERLETVGRLAGGVAHDFNNLLTGVLLYCDLLIAYLEPCHRVRKYAEEIRKAGIQATGLVRQLLAVARPGRSEQRLLSLNEIAEGMRNLLVRLIGENIQLNLQLDSSLGLVKMDPTQAQQILLNLVLNARDAMPDGGTIAIETRNCKVQVLPDSGAGNLGAAALPCALFVVSDNGCGMDTTTRTHLFEAFFTTKDRRGTGLGLATVQDIVTGHGGLIHVDSAPGCGTRVSVLLPLVAEMLPELFAPSSQGRANDFCPGNRDVLIPKK